jgi:hypothetical protein
MTGEVKIMACDRLSPQHRPGGQREELTEIAGLEFGGSKIISGWNLQD